MLNTRRLGVPDAPSSRLPEPSLNERRLECLARAGIYRLLAGVFVEEPSLEFIAALREPAVLASLAQAGLVFDADFSDSALDALVDALNCEYTCLFVASGGFPPVESVRLMGRYQQDPQFQTARLYQEAGFALGPGRFSVFSDQLGVELMFGAELLERAAKALEGEDLARYRDLEKAIKRFWTQHLGRWVRGYSRLIERAAQHSFYREMARFLGGFAEEEIAALGLRHLDDLDLGRIVVPKSPLAVTSNPEGPVCGGAMGPSDGQNPGVSPLSDLCF